MKKTKSRVDTSLSNKSIQIYVNSGVHQDVKELSTRTGLSISSIAWMAFSEGYPKVRETLLKLKAGKKPNVQPTAGN